MYTATQTSGTFCGCQDTLGAISGYLFMLALDGRTLADDVKQEMKSAAAFQLITIQQPKRPVLDIQLRTNVVRVDGRPRGLQIHLGAAASTF